MSLNSKILNIKDKIKKIINLLLIFQIKHNLLTIIFDRRLNI